MTLVNPAGGRADHAVDCFCSECHTLKSPILTTQAWIAAHAPHALGAIKEEPYPHPDGDWIRLVCPCGKGHITIKRGGVIL